MANTALGRTETAILTNKSGGSVAQGDVVIVDTANASAFTTTTTVAYVNGRIGVVLEPNGIANNVSGLVAFSGYVPVINLSGTGSIGDLAKTHSVAKQAVRHAAGQVAGDFAQVLGTSATPAALLFGTVQLGGGSGAVAGDTIWDAKGDLAVGTGADTAQKLTVGSNGTALIADSGQTTGLKYHPSPAFIPGGRLTLTSGTPVTTTDVTGATSIYYAPFTHNEIQLWDGTVWLNVSFSETTLALGTLTSGLPYDVFGYLSGGSLALESLAWTNGTTRATGISIQDGRYCKTGDKTRLYLGTFYTTSTTTTEDSASKRFLWNMHNRTLRHLYCKDTTDSWTYTTATFRPSNNDTTDGTGRFSLVVGLSDDELRAHVHSMAKNGGSQVAFSAGVGIDSTSTNSAQICGGVTGTTGQYAETHCEYYGYLAVGFHYIQRLELSQASNTTTWVGDLGVTYIQTGMTGALRM